MHERQGIDLQWNFRAIVRAVRVAIALPFLFFFLWSVMAIANEIDEAPITGVDRDHWSFLPLQPPQLPTTKSTSPNAIDIFVAARLEDAQIIPLPEASRETLLRRLKFDLLGLPPTPREVEQFSNDESPDSYEKLVDQFLASPHHGERWAQHWLDLARFAETDGFEHDKVRPNAWKYRDWVINALNEDLPYDRFLQLQIAGDLIEPQNEAAQVATAFCLSGPDMPDINSQDERRHNLLNELTSTIGAAVIGLQIGCAQCHDHKYDPISQADFYRMRAFFDSAVNVKRDKSVFTMAESTEATTSRVWLRGDYRSPGPAIAPGFVRVAGRAINEHAPSTRADLANWLTQPDHPLTTRVIVNRVWQHHFGKGLSDSGSDFGVMGDSPSHPKLLDWLAVEFVRNNWSLKWLHRQIVTSATYRRSSRPVKSSEKQNYALAKERDRRNELLAHFPRRRLSGETLRDAMLSISETINDHAGGPGVRPPLPKEVLNTLLRKQWETTKDQSQHHRRSIYVFVRRNLRYPIFDVFDRPDGNASCSCRDESTTATQSLLMLNSEQSLTTAKQLAGVCLELANGDFDGAAELAVLKCYGRRVRPEEREMFVSFAKGNEETDLVHLCLGLINSNEFFYVD